jgi:hypothetical protein
MVKIAELRSDLHEYLADHGLMKKWLKAGGRPGFVNRA